MAVSFRTLVGPGGVDIEIEERGLLSRRRIPVAEWHSLLNLPGRAAKVLLGLVEKDNAEVVNDGIRVSHSAAASLSASIADIVRLPSLAKLSATLSFDGRVDSAEGRIRIRWYDARSRSVLANRSGAFIEWGGESGRLSKELFDLVEAIETFNASVGSSTENRISLWGPVQSALHQVTGERIEADDYLGSLTIYQAASFSLDVRETSNGPDFVPVLMARSKSASLEDNAPIGEGDDEDGGTASTLSSLRDQEADALLPPDLQKRFITERFSPASAVHDAYVLDRNVFVVLDPDLRAALDVVRRKRTAPLEERRAFVRNPRPEITEALGGVGADLTSVALFVETQQYSERVLGLGVWDPPKLPWLRRKAGQWLPESFELKIGGRSVTLTPESLDDLVKRVGAAKSDGKDRVDVEDESYPIPEVETAIAKFQVGFPGGKGDTGDEDKVAEPPPIDDRQVLKIKTNIDGVEYETAHPARPVRVGRNIPLGQMSSTVAKPHQLEGFRWLVDAWAAGWPGVLLADDMGLGKTFQALAFLAWMRVNGIARDPILVVAPTALLRNWVAEADLHLAPGALGERVDAFGPGLKRLKRAKSSDWTPEDALDVDVLRSADWILTTYETLADNHRAFGRVAYSVAVFDEMQKVKAPGTINTHAAKAMNADFVLGLTGTPIENRLEDLWCIMDRIAPGYIGDLKSFSASHGDEDPQSMKALKSKLDEPRADAPAVMLRRMKEVILEGLPTKTVKTYPVGMPAPQAEAYASAVREAQAGGRSQGAMLKAIHAFRGISLHPDGADGVDGYDPSSVAEWVRKSARLNQVVGILREIERRGEKAIVFVEDRAVQAAFAVAAMTLFGLRSEPAIINGAVPGANRQAIVDRFQGAPLGFDLLVLSPKAAGVGLTITAANHVIHLSRWWNPAVEDQCNDRVYRIGQYKPVTIHVPIAIHPTFGDASFDVTLDRLLENKRALSRHMLAPPVGEGDVGALFEATVGE